MRLLRRTALFAAATVVLAGLAVVQAPAATAAPALLSQGALPPPLRRGTGPGPPASPSTATSPPVAAWTAAVQHGFYLRLDPGIGGSLLDAVAGVTTPTAATSSGGTLSVDSVTVQVRTTSTACRRTHVRFTETAPGTFAVTAPQIPGVWKVYVYAYDGHGDVGIETRSVRVVPPPVAGTNVALGKAATASSYQPTGPAGPQPPGLAVDGNNGGVDDVTLSTSGRYVRLAGTRRTTDFGYSLWELGVYN